MSIIANFSCWSPSINVFSIQNFKSMNEWFNNNLTTSLCPLIVSLNWQMWLHNVTTVTIVTKLVGTPCDVVSICSIGKDTAEPSSCCSGPQLDANLCGAESDAVASELADLYDIVVTTHGLRSRKHGSLHSILSKAASAVQKQLSYRVVVCIAALLQLLSLFLFSIVLGFLTILRYVLIFSLRRGLSPPHYSQYAWRSVKVSPTLLFGFSALSQGYWPGLFTGQRYLEYKHQSLD